MNAKEAIITALKEYRAITGLRSYLIEDEDDINSAAEKNYFCKCLKTSAAALRHCEECTSENYRNALQSDKVCMYSCHAGLVKWSMPIRCNAFSGVVISEGVITKQQVKDAETWVHYLSEHYNVRKDVLQDNYQVIKEMTEEEVNISIKLLKEIPDRLSAGDAGRASGSRDNGNSRRADDDSTLRAFLCIRFSFLSQRCYTL